MLQSPIQLEEVKIAIKQLEPDKCPGPDGFPINFYCKFLPDIQHILHAVYMRAVEDNQLYDSAR